jgi:hypothetical protein
LGLKDLKARSPLSRASIYELAPAHPGLLKKLNGATIVDFELLDQILAKLPPAQITQPHWRQQPAPPAPKIKPKSIRGRALALRNLNR